MKTISIILTCYGIAFFILSQADTTSVFNYSDSLSLFFWVIIPIPIASANLAGLLLYKDPKQSPAVKKDIQNLAIVYVTRGTNTEALNRAVKQTKYIAQMMSVEPMIYVVSDQEVIVPRGTLNIVVPQEYSPSNGSKWKARALEFFRLGVVASTREPYQVYLHLDEESVISMDLIYGINEFIVNGNPKTIGQGEILYNAHNYGNNLVTTAVDCLRTGDDLGRFRLQYKLFKKPIFGIHGSFILVNGCDYKDLSFDHGGKGSITEDAYFGLVASQKGFNFEWVNGTVHEQFPFTIKDIIKQRRRWFNGISLLVSDPIIPVKEKVVLIISHTCWSLSFGSLLWAITAFFIGYSQNSIVAIMSMVLYGAFLSIYSVGSWQNTQHLPFVKKWKYRATNLALFPFALVIESLATMYAIVFPINDFEVIKE